MSFDKVEVRVFSGPDQVQVGSNTEPDLIVINNGPKGDPGAAATIAVGTTTTGSAGTNASVTNSGTTSAAVFNFTIPRGDTGAAGASGGSSTAWRYRAKTNATSGYPTNGHLLWDNATQLSATNILVSHLDDEGSDIELFLSFFLEGQKIFIQNRDDSSQNQVWEITGTPTVTGANTSTAYYTFPVTLVSSAGAAFSNNHSILFGSITAAVNAVTSATTSDGTANLSVAYLGVVPSGSIALASTNSGGFVQLSGQAATDARSIAFPNASGNLALVASTTGAIASTDISDFTTAVEAIAPNAVTSATTSDGTASLDISNLTLSQDVTSGIQTKMTFTANPTAVGDGQQIIWQWYNGGSPVTTAAITTEATGSTSDKLLFKTSYGGSVATSLDLSNSLATFSGVVSSLGATYQTGSTFTYNGASAAAHRDALDITSADLQIESLFTLLTRQESDAGVFTANAGTATSSQDGDSLSLSATTANQRPNVYRFRNWNRNPGVSGTANAVIPVRLACAGNIYHLGSGANGASFRCGFGMVNGASAVAANANATTGRGFGWRIAWNSSTSKLEFNLWAHDGTTYVEGTGIDTGLGAGNLDGFFNIILRLASDGTVSANTWFGSSTSSSSVPSATPSVTLAGGPTSGSFANLGTPSWIAAAHSTNAPASGNSIIARISNRKLALG